MLTLVVWGPCKRSKRKRGFKICCIRFFLGAIKKEDGLNEKKKKGDGEEGIKKRVKNAFWKRMKVTWSEFGKSLKP